MGLTRSVSSALEIVSKLCDEGFSRKVKATDFLHQTWDILRGAGAGNGDKVRLSLRPRPCLYAYMPYQILDITVVVFAALVARDPQDLADLANKTDLAPTLLELLSAYPRGKDVLAIAATGASDAQLKNVGVLRTDKAHLSAVLNVIRTKAQLCPADGQVGDHQLCVSVRYNI